MPDKNVERTQVDTDWSFGWDTSLPVKITSIVLWGLVIVGFTLAMVLAKTEEEMVERNESNADRISYVAIKGLEGGFKLTSEAFQKITKETVARTGAAGAWLQYRGAKIDTLDQAQDGLDRRVRKNIVNGFLLTVEVFHEGIESETNSKKAHDLIYVVLFCVVFGLALTAVMRMVVTVPIRKILAGTAKVTLDNFDVNLDTDRKDEIGQLAKFITDMLVRLKDQQEEISKKIVLQTRAEEASKAKSMFLANMSHEIRTPMNAVLGYAQILRRDPTLSKEHRKTIEIIERSGIHLLGVINDILDFSKIEAGQMDLAKKDFDLGSCINDIAMMFMIRCQEKKLQWVADIEDVKGVMVFGDEGKVRQILINLISNAIKFTKVGSVTLKAAQSAGENCFLFSVTDTGFGIADDERDRIFRPFQQSESGVVSGGTGLGISIAKRYVEMMDGELDFRSKLGEGTSFYFTARFAGPIELAKSIVDKTSPIRKLGEKITALALDNDPVNRDVLTKMLESVGVQVVQAENGREALDKINQTSVPDILFVDIETPMMGGREFVQEFKATYGVRGKLVATAATALWKEEDQHRFDLLLNKPYQVDKIVGLIEEVANYGVRSELTGGDLVTDSTIHTIVLPEDLREKLLASAELYEITEVKQLLEKIAFLGDEEKAWSEKIQEYVQAYDMDSIIKHLIQSKPNAN